MKFRKIIFWGAVIFHFGLLVSQNFVQCMKTQSDLYYKEKSFYTNLDHQLNRGLYHLSAFNTYQTLSGTNTAYSFFAPQVCGHLEPFFQIYNDGKKIQEHYNVTLTTAEANQRFKTIFTTHLEKLDEFIEGEKQEKLKDNLDYRILDLKMHALSAHILNEVGQGDQVESGLYLYSTTDVITFCDDKQPLYPSFQKVMSYDYCLN